jgi:hypothetical protein
VRHLGFLAFPLLLLSCDSQASGTIQIITGEETDTFTQSPVPTQILVQAQDPTTGNLTTLATAPYPTDTIDLGNQDQDAVASLVVTAEDANGNALIYGSTIPLQYGALDGETLPVFVQRMGQNARLPNPPTDARQYPVVSVLSDRFLVIAGGVDPTLNSTTQVYDFAQYDLLTPAPSLPIVPASMPLMGTVALLIDTAGDGNFFDFSQDTGTSVSPPAGFAFSDVAGGQTVYDNTDGYIFVVGATRTSASGPATAAVLKIDTTDTSNSDYPYGNLSWLTLSAKRLGASATWVEGNTTGLLVVAGGSSSAPGVETIANGQTTGATLPYPPDPSTGSGMTDLLDSGEVLVGGGVMPDGSDPGVRELATNCSPCVPVTWAKTLPTTAGPAVVLTNAYTFTLVADTAFLVGNEPSSGLTHTFTLNSAGATEVPTKVPHTNAAAIASPTLGTVLFFGGANELESFTPAPVLTPSTGTDGGTGDGGTGDGGTGDGG